MSSTPRSVVSPCGLPNSTRFAPASNMRRACAATSSGVPAKKNASGDGFVGSSFATTSRYIATSARARSRAAAPSSSTTVTAPTTMPTSSSPVLEPEPVEPRALHEPEIGAPAGREVERRDLTRDLDRVQRVRVERRGAEPDPFGAARHDEQRRDRRRVEQVVEDGDHVEAGGL